MMADGSIYNKDKIQCWDYCREKVYWIKRVRTFMKRVNSATTARFPSGYDHNGQTMKHWARIMSEFEANATEEDN